MNYLFKSERLGFRNWKLSDIEKLHLINSDKYVMEFFPNIPSKESTETFVSKMQLQYKEKGFCYFAVDILETSDFIGFIGLSEQTYEAEFTPCIDIGWRLNKTFWNKGYATEGAKRCLNYAFNDLKLNKVVSIAPIINVKSEKIMKKIGMRKVLEFNHPLLKGFPILEKCSFYEIQNKELIKVSIHTDKV